MVNQPGESIIVDAALDGYSVIGLLKNVTQNRRLVDILNSQDLTLELHAAESRVDGAVSGLHYESLVLNKAGILYAMPRETSEQVRLRAFNRSGISLGSSQGQVKRVSVGVLLPFCFITGTVTLQPGTNPDRLEIAILPRFFAMTDATITRSSASAPVADVVVVNRDRLVGLGRLTA